MKTGPDINHRKASDILKELAQRATGERVSLRDIVEALGERAFGVLLLIFALPNAVGLGTIPGVSTLFGVPQIFVAVQMVMGRERLWLPAWLLDRSIARRDFQTMVDKSLPHILKIERFLRPRWSALSTTTAERLLGLVFLLLAVIVSLPIPFANQPPAVAMAFIAIGLIARDGVYVTVGLGIAALAVALAAAVVLGGAAAVWLFIRHFFGG
jgi:hypothetical protein